MWTPLWGELAANTRRLWLASSPKGFAPDWLLWTPAGKPAADTKHGNAGDYDAIRVYLWVGMLAEGRRNAANWWPIMRRWRH